MNIKSLLRQLCEETMELLIGMEKDSILTKEELNQHLQEKIKFLQTIKNNE